MLDLINFTIILTNSFVTVKMPRVSALLVMETWQGLRDVAIGIDKDEAKEIKTSLCDGTLPLFYYDPEGREQYKVAVIATGAIIAMYTHEIDTSRTEVMNEQMRLLREVRSALAAAN